MDGTTTIIISPLVAAAVGTLFTAIVSAVTALIRALWKDRASLYKKLLEMLALQFADSTSRTELWNAQRGVIEGQTREIADMKRVALELKEETKKALEDLKDENRQALAEMREEIRRPKS
jgi:hypothetical protein